MKNLYILTIGLLLSFQLSGQVEKDKTAPQLANLSIEELMGIQFFTASKTAETVRSAPSSVTVFTRQEIQNMGIDDVYDLLNYVPGFQTTRDIAVSEVQILHVRGIGGLKPYVLIQVNGERIVEIMIERSTQFVPNLNTANIKQIEIIGGPGSALYGSNAVLGVVNIITESGTNEAWIKAGTQQGSSFYACGSHKTEKGLKVSVSAYNQQDKGFEYTINNKHTTDPRTLNGINTSLHYKGFTFNSFYFENNYEDFIKYTNRVANSINENTVSNFTASLSYQKDIGKKLTLKAKASGSRKRWDVVGLAAPASPGFSHDFYTGPRFRTGDYEAVADLTFHPLPNHSLLGGASYRSAGVIQPGVFTNYLDNTGQTTPNDTFYLGEIKQFDIIEAYRNWKQFINIIGLYGQYKFVFLKNITLFTGARYDIYSVGGKSLSPRVGLIWRTPVKSTAKVMYGTAFRAPTHNELFSDDPVTTGNPKLLPERSQTFEVSYSQTIKKSESGITFFQNNIKDLIIETPLTQPATATSHFENSTDSTLSSNGLEAFFLVSPIFGLTTRLTYTYILSDPQASFNQYGSFAVNYEHKKWNFNINGIYRSKIKALPNQGDYSLLNGKIRFRATSKLEFNISCINITDKRYFTFSERISRVNQAMPNRGRQIWIGINIKL